LICSFSGYKFGGWYTAVNGGGTLFTNSTPVTADVTLYAKWTAVSSPSGGSGGGGGGGGGGGDTSYSADVSGNAASVSTLLVTVDRENAAVGMNTKQSDKIKEGGNIVIDIPPIPGINTYSLNMPNGTLSASDGKGTITIKTQFANVTLPSNMLTGINGADKKAIQISISEGDKSKLSNAAKAAIGSRPLIQLSLLLDGNQSEWSNTDAPVKVSIAYEPTAEELLHPESIIVWYIDGSGKLISVPNGRYDPATKTVTFETTHFSYFGVGYNNAGFKDVAPDAWYQKAIGFVASRNIATGMGKGYFYPDEKLTRSQFIVMLMKAYGIAPDSNQKDNFADAGNTWYTGYLAEAKRLGISSGIGGNLFAPEKQITRQETFVMLNNALKVMNMLPQNNTGKSLSDFRDSGTIASWAEDAMKLMVESGTVGGSNGMLLPENSTTRAEMAQVLYTLLTE
jgi:uncharacterized repeat protein (TIGR02543 family)